METKHFFLNAFLLSFPFLNLKDSSIETEMDIPDGWDIIEDTFMPKLNEHSLLDLYVPERLPKIKGNDLFLQLEEEPHSFEYLLGRENANFLFNNKSLIPKEWEGRTLPIMGTRYLRLNDGILFVEEFHYQFFQKVWRRGYFCLSEGVGPFCSVPVIKHL